MDDKPKLSPMQFLEYYSSETNKRLDRIESDMSKLLQLRAQIFFFIGLFSATMSVLVTVLTGYFFK